MSQNENGINDAVALAHTIVNTIRESALILDKQHRVLVASSRFYKMFNLKETDILDKPILEIDDKWKDPGFQKLLHEVLPEKGSFSNFECDSSSFEVSNEFYLINGGVIGNGPECFILLTFEVISRGIDKYKSAEFNLKNFQNILEHAPAMICILRGPNHVYEVANDKYYQLVGHNRQIIGKPVREALPEVEGQGFFELLDKVWESGEPYIGDEVPIKINISKDEVKSSFIDFVYQPTFDATGKVDGIFVYVVDVGEKVRIRKVIEQREAELTELIDTVPAIIWITNPTGESIYLNESWLEYTGQSLQEAKKYGWLDVIHPDDKEFAKETFFSANNERRSFSATFRIRNKSGEYRYVIDSGKPKYSLNGDYEGMLGTVVDIHEDMSKDKRIRDSEHRYQELIHSSPSLIATFRGRDYIIEIANDAILEAWGVGRECIGKPLLEVLPELKEQGFDNILKEVYTTGKPFRGYEMPIQIKRDDKLEQFYFNFIYYPQRDALGNIVGIVDIATEVTPQAILNQTIKDSETHFRQMADLMPTKVTNADASGNFIYYNQDWLDYTGLDKEEMKTQGWIQLIHPKQKKDFIKSWENSLATGSNFEKELKILNKNGKYKWHLSRAEAIIDEDDKIKMWICTNTQIQKLKEEEKRKGDFLKMVSHELKTPVTSIKGYVQLLLGLLNKGNFNHLSSLPLKPSLERIDHQIRRLTRLISEMLDLSRIEENKLELKKEIFCLNDLVTETVQDINYTNTQHKIKVINKFQCQVYADKDRIGQVLINFITNAVKYSPNDQNIEVKISKTKDYKVAVSVKDNGMGIEKKYHKNIFKRFYRVGVKSEETYAGFGIGLYLANEIIQRHDGVITLRSKKGKGAEFIFTLNIYEGK